MDAYITQVYQRCYRPLVAQVYGSLGEHNEAQDVVQEAFAIAMRDPEHFTNLRNPDGWLRQVAVNLVRKRWRRRKVFERIAPKLEQRARTLPEVGPDHVALVVALQRVEKRLREVLVLHYLVDLPLEAVAEAVQAPVGTVKSRLARGRELLSQLLDEEIPTHQMEARHA